MGQLSQLAATKHENLMDATRQVIVCIASLSAGFDSLRSRVAASKPGSGMARCRLSFASNTHTVCRRQTVWSGFKLVVSVFGTWSLDSDWSSLDSDCAVWIRAGGES